MEKRHCDPEELRRLGVPQEFIKTAEYYGEKGAFEVNNTYGQCSECEAPKKLIHRVLTLTDGEGKLLDQARFCEDCWRGYRADIYDATNLSDGNTV